MDKKELYKGINRIILDEIKYFLNSSLKFCENIPIIKIFPDSERPDAFYFYINNYIIMSFTGNNRCQLYFNSSLQGQPIFKEITKFVYDKFSFYPNSTSKIIYFTEYTLLEKIFKDDPRLLSYYF